MALLREKNDLQEVAIVKIFAKVPQPQHYYDTERLDQNSYVWKELRNMGIEVMVV